MKQVLNGKSFEYALAMSLRKKTGCVVDSNKSFEVAKKYYDSLSNENKQKLNNISNEIISFLCSKDLRVKNTKFIYLQKDSAGIKGDVRDIVLEASERTIGISAKNNNNAIKHSRLSSNLDFGKEWTGISCSDKYFDEIKPIFDLLKSLKKDGVFFRDLKNKDFTIYIPILEAFSKELKVLNLKDLRFPQLLFSYLVGYYDFYKVIAYIVCHPLKATIQSYNMNGTLGYGEKWKMPEKIISIAPKAKSTNTIIVRFNEGWSISFRIHNASTKVESSLKFDINLIEKNPCATSHTFLVKS